MKTSQDTFSDWSKLTKSSQLKKSSTMSFKRFKTFRVNDLYCNYRALQRSFSDSSKTANQHSEHSWDGSSQNSELASNIRSKFDSEDYSVDLEKKRSGELEQLARRYRKASISVTHNDKALLDGTGGLRSPLVILKRLKTSNYSIKCSGIE